MQTTLALTDRVTRSVDLVASRMRSNRLNLNSDKTEVTRRQHQLPVLPMLINGSLVNPVRTVRNLAVFIDADLVMRSHVTRVVAQCFAVLLHLWLISQLLSPTTLKMVVVALVLSRLDNANSVMTGLPAYLVKRLLSVLSASAIRPCLRSSDVTALVAHPRTYSVQIGGIGPPSSSRQRSRIPRIFPGMGLRPRRLGRLGLETVSRPIPGLVSALRPNVSVSSRSRELTSRSRSRRFRSRAHCYFHSNLLATIR